MLSLLPNQTIDTLLLTMSTKNSLLLLKLIFRRVIQSYDWTVLLDLAVSLTVIISQTWSVGQRFFFGDRIWFEKFISVLEFSSLLDFEYIENFQIVLDFVDKMTMYFFQYSWYLLQNTIARNLRAIDDADLCYTSSGPKLCVVFLYLKLTQIIAAGLVSSTIVSPPQCQDFKNPSRSSTGSWKVLHCCNMFSV